MSDETIYARDLDGTGSMHICAKGDPGAVAFMPVRSATAAIDEIEHLRSALAALVERYEEIVQHDWVGRGMTDHDLVNARAALSGAGKLEA